MTSLPDDQLIIINSNLRTGVTVLRSNSGEIRQNIQFGDDRGRVTDSGGFGGNATTDFLEQAFFDLENAFLRRENLFFVFLELRCCVSLRANERLLPVVIGRNQVPVGIRDLDVVAENAIE